MKESLSPITYRRISLLAIFRKHAPKYYIFRQSELESVILWNRILVYATLYGQAKK